MRTRGQRVALAAAVGLALIWATAQLFLERHALLEMHADELRARASSLALHPTIAPAPVMPLHVRFWLLPATESLIALVVCAIVSAAIVAGGRRWWALMPAGLPLTSLIGLAGYESSLGLGWAQPFTHFQTWLAAGAAVDAAVVGAIALLLRHGLSARPAATPLGPAVLRSMPIAVVAFGWWYVGQPVPDPHSRIFAIRTLLLVLTVAVVVTLRLPPTIKAVVLLVMPFAEPNLSDGLINGYVSWSTYFDHVAVGAATAAYVVAVPAVFRQLQVRKSDGSASNAPTSAIT